MSEDTHIAGAPMQPGQVDSADQDQEYVEQGESREERLIKRYKTETYAVMGARLLQLRSRAARLEQLHKLLKEEVEVIAIKTIPERFAADGFKTLNLDGIGRLQLRADAWCNTIPEKGEELQDWLNANNHSDLIKPTINPSTLKSFVKELYKDHIELAAEFDPATAMAEDPMRAPLDEDGNPVDTRSEFEQISDFVKFTPYMAATVVKAR